MFGKTTPFTASISVANLNGSNGFCIDGVDGGDRSGRSVASAGDVNGDGYSDLIVGAPGASPGGDAGSGESYVVFGAAGFSAQIDLSTLNGSNGFRLDGISASDSSGSSVASAGDVNGDGFDDLIVGAFGAGPGGVSFGGQSYVVFGQTSGFTSALSLSALNGSNGFTIEAGDVSGFAVASAGDVNGDGLDDLVVGAPYADTGGDANAGESYVVFGRKPDTAVTRFGTVADQSLVGGDFGDYLLGLGGDDSLWGHGGTDALDGGIGQDIMRGGAGNDNYETDNAGDLVIELLNEGYDTVDTSLMTYLLRANVERVNYTGGGNFVGTGNTLANCFQSGGGDDRFVDVQGGADIFSGGAGTDTVDFRTSATGAVLNFITNVHTGAAAGDSFSSIEKFLGSNTAEDRMSAGGTGRVIYVGNGGDDRLNGGAKNDQLIGGSGNDIIKGNADRDSLDGGTGNDTMTGGTQGDVFVFVDAAFGQDTITDYQDGIDSFKIFSAVADNLAGFTITGNGTTSVRLTLASAPANFITINGASPITIAADDFVFY